MDPPVETPATLSRNVSSTKEDIAYYKAQYEQLENELQEFQASSRELEVELEKEVEASEKRERQLKQQLEKLGYEVEEWKTKYKQSKNESNAAQIGLQKEITVLREVTRTLQLKLRDIEVANDDYERQARHTTSSLEDVESKYNVAIERGVMLEEEMKAGEQERQSLRIETQRLRDELSDLRIEAEITQNKLRHAENFALRRQSRRSNLSTTHIQRSRSPFSERSITSTTSPALSTPPPGKSETSTTSQIYTPPSPPLSDASARPTSIDMAPLQLARDVVNANSALPSRPLQLRLRASVNGQEPSQEAPSGQVRSIAPRGAPATAGLDSISKESLPRSGSLYQIRGLIGKMQKLEERVHSARSKLPAPACTPQRPSPRAASSSASDIPASVTVRSNRRRPSGSTTYSAIIEEQLTPSVKARPSRLSFGVGPPTWSQTESGRPESRTSVRPGSSGGASGRPSSRASVTDQSLEHLLLRPSSRASMSSSRASMGHHVAQSIAESRRPVSSLSGNYASLHSHRGHSASVNNVIVKDLATKPSTARRTTLDKNTATSDAPASSTLVRRQSGGIGALSGATPRQRMSLNSGYKMKQVEMGPPERKRGLSDVGETF